MSGIRTYRRLFIVAIATVMSALPLVVIMPSDPAGAVTSTTAWQSGAFQENVGGIVSRSDIVLGSVNSQPKQSMALGNGALGVAAWSQNGFTAQLNRDDTFPDRKSPGLVQIPGLEAMTSAANFSGLLDLYNGVLEESGGGMTLKAWVASNKDELIVDVTGANPSVLQTANVSLGTGRSPTAAVSGSIGTLAETWVDNVETGSSGNTFGSLAAITAGGQSVTASVVNSEEVQVSFYPNSNGSFRVIVAAPTWTGGNAGTTASTLIGSDASASESSLLTTQSTWWNNYWANSGLIEVSSSDGSGEYMENLRTIYLYMEASLMRGQYPGSQAGQADLFNFSGDGSEWDPAAYWIWDLRTQIFANMDSGNFAMNIPIFNLYLNDLSAIESWTNAQMGGTPGACIPETMRFNGNGYYAGGTGNASCSQASSPSYNALTITSGAEVALWVWMQYQDTRNLSFLETYYPIMKQTAIFLLDYQTLSGGELHATANAHETQWAVSDPTTDIAAMTALFPAVVSAANILGVDSSLVSQLTTAEGEIPPYARTDEATHTQLLTASSDSSGTDVIGDSYNPTAPFANVENIGLEPVWPYGVIGDTGALSALADRTFTYRPYVSTIAHPIEYSFDAIDAARLGMASQVQSNLIQVTESNQAFISGMAFVGGVDPYIEQSGDVAYTLSEALAQDYNGILQIAPAWPSDWNGSGTVSIQDGSKVDVQVENGTPVTVAIQAGTTETMQVDSPWSGQAVEVVNGSTGATVVSSTTTSPISVPVTAGQSYLVEEVSSPTTSLPFAQVTGTQATVAKVLGPVQIGLLPSLSSTFNDVGITNNTNTAPGNFDGGGLSFSEQALTAVGAAPGETINSSGMSFIFPNVAAGANDNTVAEGQTIALSGSSSELGFLVSGSYGGPSGTGTVTYTDGTQQTFTLNSSDWWNTTPPSGGAVAAESTYLNYGTNQQYTQTATIFSEAVSINPAKTLQSVTLPAGGALTSGTAALHIWAISTAIPLANSFNDVGISNDTNTAPGNYDGGGFSFSEQALTAAGLSPGSTVNSSGLAFTMPNVSAGTNDNTVANGQQIALSGSSSELGFIVSGSDGGPTGTCTVTYTDGSQQSFTLNDADWWNASPPSGGALVASTSYINYGTNQQYTHTVGLYSEAVAIDPTKTLTSVTLPSIGPLVSGSNAMHVWAISTAASSLAATYNDIGITANTNTAPGNFDGSSGRSFSETALTAVGASPGATISSSGMSFTFPNVSAGTNDNTVADGQQIALSGSTSEIGFLVAGSYGGPSGTGTITYTDGTQQSFTLNSSDWWSTTPPSGGALAADSAYLNVTGNTTYSHSASIFSVTVATNSSKTLASVTLPTIGALQGGVAALHVFAIAT
jgi:hypothetical protein